MASNPDAPWTTISDPLLRAIAKKEWYALMYGRANGPSGLHHARYYEQLGGTPPPSPSTSSEHHTTMNKHDPLLGNRPENRWEIADYIFAYVPAARQLYPNINSMEYNALYHLYEHYHTRFNPPKTEEAKQQELPHLRLIKLMGMTGSANDPEAILALRKATELLNSCGWTWESLIMGKVKVIEDPFKSVPDLDPTRGRGFQPSAPPAPGRPTAAAPHTGTTSVPPRPAPPPPKPAQPAAPAADWLKPKPAAAKPRVYTPPPQNPAAPPGVINSSRKNQYGNDCYCCGIYVDANQGWIFKPKDFNANYRKDGWKVVCTSCNNDPMQIVRHTPALPKGNSPARRVTPVNLQDLF